MGRVEALGEGAGDFRIGDRVGVAWIYSACGHCDACRRGEENLCDQYRATGRDAHGGYAERMVVPSAFAHAIPDVFADVEAAPLLCAGAIGFRSLRLAGLEDGRRLGLTGFGASAHLVLKLVRHQFPNTRVLVFARTEEERTFARELGAAWAGDTREPPPSRSTRSSTPPPPGRRSSRRWRTSSAAGGWSSTRSAKRTPTSRRCWRSTTPGTSGSRRRSRASPT